MMFHFELTDVLSSIVYVTNNTHGGWDISAYVYDEGEDVEDIRYSHVGRFLGYDCIPDAIYSAINKALPESVEIDYLWDIILADEGFNGECGCAYGRED